MKTGLLACLIAALMLMGCEDGGVFGGDPVNVSGYWKVSSPDQQWPHDSILYLSQVGKDIVGILSDYGSVSSLAGLMDWYIWGEVRRNSVNLFGPARFHGEVSGNAMSGSVGNGRPFKAQRGGADVAYVGPTGGSADPIGIWDYDKGGAHVNTEEGWWPYLKVSHCRPEWLDYMNPNMIGFIVPGEFLGLQGAINGQAIVFQLNGADTFLGGINDDAMNGLWVQNARRPSDAGSLEEGRWTATRRP